ncbi:hypothetical protein Nepgr_025538 [Nepenthes gracilis]|uniref:Uncharacterized protein n=1 Tax=Nepenthes gracilis TaxID=150966 RepID=A0AAD3T684_NEPGR|nr:hypothetical protein Nepgr_025538 [Nepenthes gracilis]
MPAKRRRPRERKVPSTPFTRALGFAGLGWSCVGTVEESAKRLMFGNQDKKQSDESLIPAPILAALEIVRQGADVMPRSQLNQVLNTELGLNGLQG